jgi:hypothetical protein
MKAFTALFSAVRSLADNLTVLADTVAEVNRSVRCHLRLDEMVHPEEIDHRLNGFLPPAPPPAPEPPAEPDQTRTRGRKKAADPSPVQQP